jgi:ribosome modulation factor
MSPDVPEPPSPPGVVVRTAVWIGTAFGRWQRRRAAARDDSFVDNWKRAWNEGCSAHRAGKTEADVPYDRSPGRDAWLAGWRWANGPVDAERR